MNYWLSVLSENALLASQTIAELSQPAGRRLPDSRSSGAARPEATA
jgi:hypothetical protein